MIQTKPHWKNLKGVQAWLPELRQLLSEAREAAAQNETELRIKVSQLLAGFVQESWPRSPEMDRLDDLAQQTADALLTTDIRERLRAIAGRTAQYEDLTKEIEAVAEHNESASDSIRLKSVQHLIDSTEQVVASARTLAASLNHSSADERKIVALIEEAVGAVEKLRGEVARLI